jgi:MFS family permease
MNWFGPSAGKQEDLSGPPDPAPKRPAGDADERVDLRETFRQQLIDSIGGWSGALIAAVPTIVFIIVNVTTSLAPAIYAAVGSALLLTAYRLVRKQSIQQAVSGLFGVLIAAVIAHRTGQARGYFLFGIWTSFLYAVPLAISLVVRRPLVGVLWEFLDPSAPPADDRPWHRRRPLLLAYSWATLAVTIVFLARGGVQAALYHQDATGWLAFARIAMGYPLFVAAVGFSFWVVQRARKRLPGSAGEHGAA